MSALSDAHEELDRRSQRADRAGDWRERSILEPLASVADYVKRIGDHRDSAHYRADKAGPLVRWAIGVQRAAHEAYAPGDDATVEAIGRASRALRDAADAVNAALWLISRNGGQVAVPVDRLAGAAEALSRAVDAAWDEIEGEDW